MPVPKAYEVIADDLRRSILEGEREPGDRPPSAADLARHHGRSAPTVQNAQRLLNDEGLIDKHHGRGTFARRPRTPRANRAATGATERATALHPGGLVFHAEYREAAASAEPAGAFGVPEGTVLLRCGYRTRRSAEPAPFHQRPRPRTCRRAAR
ncbi:GntR family transcriptional regulator [Streptomyces sp. NPDC058830]|uniref:GntR family transcriptional regulator n=1 Tax=Streptomyces sp. NPDC058830 TaxID=3346645 RepID=UPI0036C0A727